MKIGLHVNSFTWPMPGSGTAQRLAAIARRAEEAGFDSFWPMDHFIQLEHSFAVDELCLKATRSWHLWLRSRLGSSSACF
jgi:alkanesulfonate monooxygenase SsuD/methylene tetrahydromethanopterin reductase-like flavin-dependent oxidoreductase (luciferase family)